MHWCCLILDLDHELGNPIIKGNMKIYIYRFLYIILYNFFFKYSIYYNSVYLPPSTCFRDFRWATHHLASPAVRPLVVSGHVWRNLSGFRRRSWELPLLIGNMQNLVQSELCWLGPKRRESSIHSQACPYEIPGDKIMIITLVMPVKDIKKGEGHFLCLSFCGVASLTINNLYLICGKLWPCRFLLQSVC